LVVVVGLLPMTLDAARDACCHRKRVPRKAPRTEPADGSYWGYDPAQGSQGASPLMPPCEGSKAA